jgi:hypothetical protein
MKNFLGKLLPCLYLAHFSCGAIFFANFLHFQQFQNIFFYGFKILLGMIADDANQFIKVLWKEM